MKHVAGVIVVRKDGAVLVQHRDNKPGIFYPGYWAYPGGVVEENESYQQAALRELKEETGYTPGQIFELANEFYNRTDGEKMNRHVYWTIYDDQQPISCYEGQEVKFLKNEDFKDKKFLTGQERLFKLAIKFALK